ncbi:transcription factor subunit Med10 of mediator complex-domain-containing protein [Dipodascopsis tothii]|uniref:transcription factor subunit Med10 of mediator complex-domain-containing protein n=1 Tax=Dipodascopsis tothii TaxID=44089 RepID=UPI0034CFCA50
MEQPPATTTTIDAAKEQRQLETLQRGEDRLRTIIESLLELAITVHDYEGVAESRDTVVERVNSLTAQLAALQKPEPQDEEVLVPREIIQYIEDGRNPNVYTREFVELLLKQNQFVNGKLKVMRDFRDVLADQIKEHYPELTADVDTVIANTGPSFPSTA